MSGQNTWMDTQVKKSNQITNVKKERKAITKKKNAVVITSAQEFPKHLTEECLKESDSETFDGRFQYQAITFSDKLEYKGLFTDIYLELQYPVDGNDFFRQKVMVWAYNAMTQNNIWENGNPVIQYDETNYDKTSFIKFRANNLKDIAKTEMLDGKGFSINWSTKIIGESYGVVSYKCTLTYEYDGNSQSQFSIMNFRKSDGMLLDNKMLFKDDITSINGYKIPVANAAFNREGMLFDYGADENHALSHIFKYSELQPYLKTEVLALATNKLGVVKIDGISYLLDGNQAIVVKQKYSLGELTIPESVTYNIWHYNVTAIEKGCFYDNNNLTNVTIPNTISEIPDSAFANCNILKHVGLPLSVKKLGNKALFHCFLANIQIPNDVISLGDSCLVGTTLPSIKLLNIQTIGEGCFSLCRFPNGIVLPLNGIFKISKSCFEGSNLKSISLPLTITSIEDDAFKNCSFLEAINLKGNLKQIGNRCFQNCTALWDVQLPSSTISLGDSCFAKCSALTSISFPPKIKSLGAGCFMNTKMDQIVLPVSIDNIGDKCFKDCDRLMQVKCLWMDPSSKIIGIDAFNGINMKAILYIPKGSKKFYKKIAPWMYFNDINNIKDNE